MASALYISYDGMAEPLGLGQVIAYVEALALDHDLHIMSFEKPTDLDDPAKMAMVRERLDKAGIGWTPLRYHKSPSAPATLYDVTAGTAKAISLCRELKPDFIHARSYLPALIALPLKRIFGIKLLFDIRGFWADERVDGGLWSAEGRVYRTVKWLEKRFFQAADHIVTLTEGSVPVIEAMDYAGRAAPPITVIPTCADLTRFTVPDDKANEPFVFGYVGNFGKWYLLDETMALFMAIREQRPGARMLVINRVEEDHIRVAADRAGVPQDVLEVFAAEHSDVPAYVQRMHAAAALVKPCFSQVARAPTKLAEYLGCGVPAVEHVESESASSFLESHNIGIAMRSFDADSIRDTAAQLIAMSGDPQTAARCRAAVATSHFSLSGGIERYRAIYANLAGA